MDDADDAQPGATEASAMASALSAQMKLAAVQRLMRGESLEALSRELSGPAHRLSAWRERDARDAEIERLKAKVGEITLNNEPL